MKPLMVGLCALALWAADVAAARAAWDNVFQPTLLGHGRPRASYYAAAPVVVQASPVVAAASPGCCTPVPQQQCSTSYVQRCYYQPVTTYESRSYYEPVTTYQTSYYYEPVTSYRYSCYYDPCTCSYQQVATPVTSYCMRAQNCPVQSWVQRCAQVPVTSYQKACYWQPQTTCCQTTVGGLIPVNGAPINGGAIAPPNVSPGVSPPAGNPPMIQEEKSPGGQDRYYPPETKQPPQQQMNHGGPNASWKPSLGMPAFPTTSPLPSPPPVKLDRIVVGPDATVEGTVVRSDNTPRPNARVVFVHSQQPASRQTVTANSAGRFHVSLASGTWHVYLHGADGNPIYNSRLDVRDSQMAQITLVNR